MFKKHKPDELDIRMSQIRKELNDYLAARAVGLTDLEEHYAFEYFYCEVAKIFDKKENTNA